MDEFLKAFLERLKQSGFAELHGSSADLHLRLSEPVLNELLQAFLSSQRKDHPWLALIRAAHAKGSITMEMKINV